MAHEIDAIDPGSCTDKWLAGPTFGQPVRLDALNTGGAVGDVFVSYDGLELYVARAGDIYVSRRGATNQEWGQPAVENGLSTGQGVGDYKVSVTGAGLDAFISTFRGQTGSVEIWHDTRTAKGGPWGNTPNKTYLANVNSPADDWDPHVSSDGLRLYFAPASPGGQHINVATRGSATVDFGAPAQVDVINSAAAIDNDPTLSEDERVIVFESTRSADHVRRMFYATRANAAVDFSTPAVVPIANNGSQDGPHLSADGCDLYYDIGGTLYVSSLL